MHGDSDNKMNDHLGRVLKKREGGGRGGEGEQLPESDILFTTAHLKKKNTNQKIRLTFFEMAPWALGGRLQLFNF